MSSGQAPSMTRAQRRRAERGEAKAKPDEIQLVNPVAQHFAAFVFGNSTKCDRVVQEGSHSGKSLVVCGAGPSLRDHAADHVDGADEVWAVNSALTYLIDNGHRVTHGFSIDQTPTMLLEWVTTPDVEYLVASSVHPHLVELLEMRERRMTFFHNFCNIQPYADPDDTEGIRKPTTVRMADGSLVEWEDWLYSGLYASTVRAGSGLNGVTRAIDVALYMGFESITVLGADCAMVVSNPFPEGVERGSPAHLKWLADSTVFHADGGSAITNGQTGMTLGGVIDGRHWESKPDLIITAITLVKMMERIPCLSVIGDTLPNALKDKPQEFLDRLPTLKDSRGNPIRVA